MDKMLFEVVLIDGDYANLKKFPREDNHEYLIDKLEII